MLTSRLTLAALALALTVSVGCSRDRHEINSTPFNPATLMIIDTVGGQTLWSMDIPSGQRLVYDFDYTGAHHEALKSPNGSPTSMKWWLFPTHVQGNYGSYPPHKAVDSGEVELPGSPILQKIVYREGGTTTRPDSLTSPEEAAALPPVRLELEVMEDGSIIFDGNPHEDAEIGNLFRSLYGERRIVITGKPGTPRENLLALKAKVQRPDLVTVVIPPADGDEAEAPAEEPTEDATEPAMEEEAEAADPEEGDPVDAIDGAMEGK